MALPLLASIANEWADRLGERRFPVTHGELAVECAAAGQARPTPLLLRYGPGDHANLHQDLYGDMVFPLQVAIMLNKPGEEFDGGESVFVEQQPRSQSRAIIARPAQGQGIVFPVRHRPVPDSHGYRRHAMRHGTGDVTRGNRTVLGIIFHNARLEWVRVVASGRGLRRGRGPRMGPARAGVGDGLAVRPG